MGVLLGWGFAAGALLFLGFWFWEFWDSRVRRFPLSYFGIESVQRVLRWETEDQREAIWRRGWMTSHEWISINVRQQIAIEDELKRRGVDPDA